MYKQGFHAVLSLEDKGMQETIGSDKKKRSGKSCSTSYVNIECLFYSSGSIITVTLLPALLNSFMKLQMSCGVRELRMFI